MLTKALSYRHSYTYTDSEQKTGASKGLPLNDMPEHMLNVGLDWQVSHSVNFWAQANYRGESAGGGRGEPDPAYTLADLGMIYKQSQNLTLKAGVYNLANERIDTEDYGMVLDGRRYSLAMHLKF